jgi:hypothetical protein
MRDGTKHETRVAEYVPGKPTWPVVELLNAVLRLVRVEGAET